MAVHLRPPLAIGNLRTTTKFMTTTSINQERTGASASVSAGNNRDFKQSTTAGATTAAVTKKVWGEYVSVVC